MKKLLLATILFAALPLVATAAPKVQSPPAMEASEDLSGSTVPHATSERSRDQARKLSLEEAEQARRDLDAAKVRSRNPEFWPKTKIEETVNNRNIVTEVKVTPGSTQIPYTMRREVPTVQSVSGTVRDNTMGIPKFINFGF
ncbi:MAG: hypothetical protein LUC43_01820 [Burkholderiales bacterium]|nr:hypothetical protein [Burkholderiales bacterium]